MEENGYVVDDMTDKGLELPDYVIQSFCASNENKTVTDFHMYLQQYENTTGAQAVYDSILYDYSDYKYSDNLTIAQYEDGVRQMFKVTSGTAYYIAVINNNTIIIVNSVDTEKETVTMFLKQFNFYVDETTAENISPKKQN